MIISDSQLHYYKEVLQTFFVALRRPAGGGMRQAPAGLSRVRLVGLVHQPTVGVSGSMLLSMEQEEKMMLSAEWFS